MTTTNNNMPATPEELQYWAKLDELDTSAFAGREISEEEYNRVFDAMMDGSNLVKHLAKIKQRRQELIQEACELEKYEKWLENHINEQQTTKI
jgi:uncharacterized protein YllA (UPF0747 family)